MQDYPLGKISMDSHVTHHKKILQASRGEERNHLEIGQIILFIKAFPQEKLFNRAKLLEYYQCLTGLTGDAPATGHPDTGHRETTVPRVEETNKQIQTIPTCLQNSVACEVHRAETPELKDPTLALQNAPPTLCLPSCD